MLVGEGCDTSSNYISYFVLGRVIRLQRNDSLPRGFTSHCGTSIWQQRVKNNNNNNNNTVATPTSPACVLVLTAEKRVLVKLLTVTVTDDPNLPWGTKKLSSVLQFIFKCPIYYTRISRASCTDSPSLRILFSLTMMLLRRVMRASMSMVGPVMSQVQITGL